MIAKRIAATLGTVAVAGVLSAGVAHADVPAFDTPFLDPGCLCAGLLPGPVLTHQLPGDEGTLIIGNPSGIGGGAALQYIVLPSNRVPITAIGEMREQQTGIPVQYTTYRGRPAVTVAPQQHDDHYQADTAFIDGNHLVVMYGGGATPEDAAAALANLAATLQII
ncbi:hypothetical protein [Nocardia stercoris]|uniref:DUF3558 domain-containing protein n=1 Tax=Nocardia stercoris TaxID=2483361 RepID=A0A3M2KTC8_9NOCA|nr:hypothetical protein [Nocardia stercoris]RMI27720.1 hypothetical protein EBN03_33160 [Nocardia stercoris]